MFPCHVRTVRYALALHLCTAAGWLVSPPEQHLDVAHQRRRHRATGDRGQATTEYALVLLGAALVALLLVAWATAGGGAGKIGRLFDKVIDIVTSKL